ncbi:MAG: hypothetical protein M1469_04570 [Bacteroidetes bacterium]|nr:hypothetical protein [Bacteroidota bacterium]
MRSFNHIPLLIVLGTLTFSGCTSMLLVKSAWDTNKIVVNGNDKDWGDTMFYIPDAKLTVGIQNDSKYLYVILKTTDRQQTFQILGLGMTVWFDPSGGSHETFGIHFPLARREEGGFSRQSRGTNDGGMNGDMNNSFMAINPNQLEILGVNRNGPVKMTIAELKGIQLQLNHTGEGLIYELRVPLHSSPDHPYAINPKGSQIGVQFEGGKFQMPSFAGRDGGFRRGEGEGYPGGEGGEMPGGMEGGGEGYPGQGRGEYGDRRSQRPEPPKQINFWLKVNLASDSQQQTAQ